MGTTQSKQIPFGTSTSPSPSVTSTPIRPISNTTRKNSRANSNANSRANAVSKQLKEYTSLETAKDNLQAAETVLAVATAAAITSQILKSVVTSVSVAGALASLNPVTGPAILAGCVVIAAFLKFRAGHLKLLSYLAISSRRYITLMNLTVVSETIYDLMSKKNEEYKAKGNPKYSEKFTTFDLQKREILEYANLFKLQLIMAASQNVLNELTAKKIITNKNVKNVNNKGVLSSRSSFFGKKSWLGGKLGDVNRFFNSEEMINSINKALGDFFITCQFSLNRFYFFISIYRELYEAVQPEFVLTDAFKILMSGDTKGINSDNNDPIKSAEIALTNASDETAAIVKIEKISQDLVNSAVATATVEVKELTEEKEDVASNLAREAGVQTEALVKAVNAEEKAEEKAVTVAEAVVATTAKTVAEATTATTKTVAEATTATTKTVAEATTAAVPEAAAAATAATAATATTATTVAVPTTAEAVATINAATAAATDATKRVNARFMNSLKSSNLTNITKPQRPTNLPINNPPIRSAPIPSSGGSRRKKTKRNKRSQIKLTKIVF